MPDVPTIAEAGLPGYEVKAWYGVLVPAATPPAVIDRLNAELVRVLALPEVKAQYLTGGLVAVSSTPAEFSAYIRREYDKWGKVIRDAGIRAD